MEEEETDTRSTRSFGSSTTSTQIVGGSLALRAFVFFLRRFSSLPHVACLLAAARCCLSPFGLALSSTRTCSELNSDLLASTMTTLREFRMDDLLKFNHINLDVLTETYNGAFYMSYLSQWPESFVVAESAHGDLMGYVIGKAEGEQKLWHGHVSAVTVAPSYRRLGLAKTLMDYFETISVKTYNAYFVDLFVRASNHLAIGMYEKFGYVAYRRVLGYYSGELPEDALDMRKALPRDVHKESVVPLDHPVYPHELEW